ncbi:hypothetical protein [Streptomyces sp. NBC_00328]|uniref:hypothetical protein n=1 Tax=Streptomyces sp. NBC_00328 TaxID=2903646 RepID=UPI002E29F075|nr:hypothetical protein [Streptomyces sp. NBC_00328]
MTDPDMAPQGRLNCILTEGKLRGFAPFGAKTPVLCFSESPPDHLAHLIADKGFAPWGIVTTRSKILARGGGAVAYLPRSVAEDFPAPIAIGWSQFKRTG